MTYELDLPDGRILRTRVSHPVDRTDHGASLWRHILDDQLMVSDEEFWACVRDKQRPRRGLGVAPPRESVPADVVYQLLKKVGLAEAEVAEMTRDQAIAALRRFWTTQADADENSPGQREEGARADALARPPDEPPR